MEDKTFELLEKMYVEFNRKFEKIDGKVDNMEKEIKSVNNRLAILENELKPKVETAMEGYKLCYEKLQEHDKRFDTVENKVDNLSMRLTNQEAKFSVLEGGKK